jgi:hypothetical protein
MAMRVLFQDKIPLFRSSRAYGSIEHFFTAVSRASRAHWEWRVPAAMLTHAEGALSPPAKNAVRRIRKNGSISL